MHQMNPRGGGIEPVISTTVRIHGDLLRELQHVCIDRRVSQTDAMMRGIRLWIDGWEERAAAHEFAPIHDPALKALRDLFVRGVSVPEVVAALTALGREAEISLQPEEGPRELAVNCLRLLRRLLAGVEKGATAKPKRS